jgi:hypothetical protein
MNLFHTHERTSRAAAAVQIHTPRVPRVRRSQLGEDRGVRFRVPHQLTRAYEEASSKQQAASSKQLAACSKHQAQQAASTKRSKRSER